MCAVRKRVLRCRGAAVIKDDSVPAVRRGDVQRGRGAEDMSACMECDSGVTWEAGRSSVHDCIQPNRNYSFMFVPGMALSFGIAGHNLGSGHAVEVMKVCGAGRAPGFSDMAEGSVGGGMYVFDGKPFPPGGDYAVCWCP